MNFLVYLIRYTNAGEDTYEEGRSLFAHVGTMHHVAGKGSTALLLYQVEFTVNAKVKMAQGRLSWMAAVVG